MLAVSSRQPSEGHKHQNRAGIGRRWERSVRNVETLETLGLLLAALQTSWIPRTAW